MITKNNEYINNDHICFIRNIISLEKGYDKRAYPEYSIFSNKKYYIPVPDLSGINILPFYRINDTIPSIATCGYPTKSKIDYYINLKHISLILPNVWKQQGLPDSNSVLDSFEIHFFSGCSLIIYNVTSLEKLYEELENGD